MTRALFTQDQFFAVADAIAAEGKEVTALALLSKLGGSSMTTIYKHLLAWKDARQQEPPRPAKAIPEVVQSAFIATLSRAWSTAVEEASKEVSAAKEKAAEEVHSANRQFEEAVQTIERLEQEAETQISRISELEAALQKSENEKSGLKATVEHLRDQVDSHQAELARAHKAIEAERQRHKEELQHGSNEFEKAQEGLNKQIASLKDSLTECQNKVGLAQIERDEARMKADIAISDKTKAEQLTDFARKEKEQALQEAAQARGQIEALKSQNSELMSKLAAKGK